MQNIIYKSENIIPWDTQSAFKMTSYKAQKEEHMIFCYLKGYVHKEDLILCSYCFEENPVGKDNIQLYLNLNPATPDKLVKISFGYEGLGKVEFMGEDISHLSPVEYSSFKTDDEQGFYWCGEIKLKKDIIQQLFETILEEKSIITLNMVQTFDNGDFSVLYGDAEDEKYNPVENMNSFVILNY